MNDKLQQIRSQLQYNYDNLQNITTQDIIDLRWPIKHRIFLELFTNCNLLLNEYEDIQKLNESRDNDLVEQKAKKVDPKVRKELDVMYRKNFMQVVLHGLERLKWPPSMIAFSNPLNELMEDHNTALNAVEFILALSNQSNFSNDHLNSPNHSKVVPKKSNVRKIPSSNAMVVTKVSSLEDVKIAKVHSNEHYTQSFQSETSTINNLLTSQPTIAKEYKIASAKEFHAISFEILQHQNEMLSKQLKNTQEAIIKRESIETKILSIINDLKILLNEGNHIESLPNNREEKTSLVEKDQGNTSQLQEIQFLKEIENEETLRFGKKSTNTIGLTTSTRNRLNKEGSINKQDVEKGSTMMNNRRPVSSTSNPATKPVPLTCSRCNGTISDSTSDAVVPRVSYGQKTESKSKSASLSQLLSKVVALESQYQTIIHSIRSNAFQATPAHRHTQPFMKKENASKKLGMEFNDLRVDWDDESDRYSPSINSSRSQNHSSQKLKRTTAHGSVMASGSHPSCILIHRVLGVEPPLSLINSIRKIESSHPDYETDSYSEPHHSMKLDMKRIHQLQTDLIQFSNKTFHWSERIRVLLTNDPTSNTLQLGDLYQESLAIQSQAAQLLLHVSSFAPLAPITLNNSYGSHLTGLESFTQEVQGYMQAMGDIKSSVAITNTWKNKLQQSSDRAKSEQLNLIRCWIQSQQSITQWNDFYHHKISLYLKQFQKKYQQSIQEASNELEILSSALTYLYKCYTIAMNARVSNKESIESPLIPLPEPPSDKMSKMHSFLPENPVGVGLSSPFQMLCKGRFGVEIANLMNALHLHRDELQSIEQIIKKLRVKLMNDVKVDDEYFEKINEMTDRALQMTRGMMNKSQDSTS